MARASSQDIGPARLSGRAVLAAGFVLWLLVAAVIARIGYLDYRDAFAHQRTGVELFARVLEEHATRTIDTAAIALSSLAERIAVQTSPAPAEMQAVLQHTSAPLPFMRAVALVDRRGVIVASSVAEDVGRGVDVRRLGAWPVPGRDRLGVYRDGRGLTDLGDPAARGAAPPGVGFIPMLRALKMRSGEDLLLVGVLNPEAFSTYQTLTLADARSVAVLASYDGDVLASSSPAVVPGSRIASHAVFREYMAASEHVSYLGAGLRPEPQVVAFRASRSRPLVVLVEHPQAAVRAEWREEVLGYAAIAATTLAILAATTVIGWRGLLARERARLLLAQREQELSVTLRSVQNLIFRADAAGAVTFVNARWSLVTGSAPEAALGRRVDDFVLPEQRARVRALFIDDAAVGARTEQAGMRCAGGVLLHFEIAVTPLLNAGRVVGFAGSAVDVTERVMAQQRLQNQYAVTALMLEASPLPLALRDLSGRYLSVNRAWEQFTGCPRETTVGTCAVPHLGEADTAFRGGGPLMSADGRAQIEATVTHADGSRRDVVVSAALVPGEDHAPASVLTVLMDVSEFRAAERATREARDAAEEASRAKSEFIANVSHELRTPLQSILGFSELGAARGAAHEKLAAMFREIHASGERMLALVNDLLDVAKIESSAGTLHLERADLRPLVRDVARELEPLVAHRQLQLDLELAEYPILAKVDPLRFRQVVRNVLANAIKFSPLQGRIVIRGEQTAAEEVHLVISDQGPGIPQAEVDQVFGAFIQSSKTKDGSGGTGLGLTICRTILEAHGGRIHAENLSAGGTAFHIHLPTRGFAETAPLPL